jgi:hypothetical protein
MRFTRTGLAVLVTLIVPAASGAPAGSDTIQRQVGQDKAFILGSASTSLARDGSGPPMIDIQKTCRENLNALDTSLGDEISHDLSVCLMDEQAARDQLVNDWANFPALAKERCVQPKEYLPGYLEWQVCLEMTRDVLKLRKEEASGTSGSSARRRTSHRRGGAVTGECPIVKYTDDGLVDYVINCSGPGM